VDLSYTFDGRQDFPASRGRNLKSRIRDIDATDIPACAEILAALPDWFGLEESNRRYIENLSRLPAAVALVSGEVVGFVSLERHNPHSVEIEAMAVEPGLHREGVGGALIVWAEGWCAEKGVRWLHVKTRGPATPDPGYERTRAFYLAAGFDPLFETLELWGPEDAALVLVKRVGSVSAGS
jgi:GNAT superfamily N-acetyltransferase